MNYKPVSRSAHSERRWSSSSVQAVAGRTTHVPLVAEELPRASRNMVCAFARNEGDWTLIAITGVAAGMNLYVEPDGRWIGGFVPALLQAYPFRLARVEDRDEVVLAVDEEGGISDDGEPFYDEAGQLTPKVAEAAEFLAKLEKGLIDTGRILSLLRELDLIEEWPVTVKRNGAPDVKLDGLYRVAEAKLNELTDVDFLKLRRGGALPIAYMQLLSTRNIDILQRLAQARAAQGIYKPAPAVELDFGEANDRDAKIDWSSFL